MTWTDEYQERKAARKREYEKYVTGPWIRHECYACNGSGRYDNDGSPKCGACGGSGKDKRRPRPGENTP